MSKCQHCHCELGPCDVRIFCSEECAEESEDIDMDLSKVTTRNLVDELQNRDEVMYITNESSCRKCFAIVEKGELREYEGEAIVLIVEGLY